MTWLKIGEEFPLEVAKADLSDAAFRLHVEGLAYAMDRENDGRFNEREVKRFAECTNYAAAVQELVDAGFWQRVGAGELQIVHHMQEQPSAAYQADKRKNDAVRKQRERETKALIAQGYTKEQIEQILEERGLKPKTGQAQSHMESREESHRDGTRDPERSGTERNGTERSGSEKHSLDETTLLTGEAQTVSDSTPSSDDPSACRTCSQGRLTDALMKRGKTSCNDCISQRSAA